MASLSLISGRNTARAQPGLNGWPKGHWYQSTSEASPQTAKLSVFTEGLPTEAKGSVRKPSPILVGTKSCLIWQVRSHEDIERKRLPEMRRSYFSIIS